MRNRVGDGTNLMMRIADQEDLGTFDGGEINRCAVLKVEENDQQMRIAGLRGRWFEKFGDVVQAFGGGAEPLAGFNKTLAEIPADFQGFFAAQNDDRHGVIPYGRMVKTL